MEEFKKIEKIKDYKLLRTTCILALIFTPLVTIGMKISNKSFNFEYSLTYDLVTSIIFFSFLISTYFSKFIRERAIVILYSMGFFSSVLFANEVYKSNCSYFITWFLMIIIFVDLLMIKKIYHLIIYLAIMLFSIILIISTAINPVVNKTNTIIIYVIFSIVSYTHFKSKFDVQEKMQENESLYRGLIESTLVGCFLYQKNVLIYINPYIKKMLGYTLTELSKFDYKELIYPNDLILLDSIKAIEDDIPTLRVLKKDGSIIYIETHFTVVTYNGYPTVIGNILDITHLKKAKDKINHIAYYDELTQLPNRYMLNNYLNKILAHVDENTKALGIMFIDLDSFKAINDEFGHKIGDMVLVEVAERLKRNTRSIDIVSRIGGDEFIVVIKDLKSPSNAIETADKLVKALNDAFIYNEKLLYIGASIGISIFPEHGTDLDTLLKNADLAMYEVKNNGGYGCSLFNNIMNDKNVHRLEVEKNLKFAMERNEFITYYQPIIDLKSMKILGAEALIRWKRDERIIQPMEFIPVAKEIGKMVEIDNWMIYNACFQCKKWQISGVKDFFISVNISYKQLIKLNFVELVMNILHGQSLDPRYLNLEITEDEAMEDINLIMRVLSDLKSQGVRISIDDFGTGYSSLNYLSMLPIDTLKIDRSLIINLDNTFKNTVIIKSIMAVASGLNIRVVAEGIETEIQFDTLKGIGCDYIQGYLIGKPMPACDFQHNFIE